jgi:hypothetical protein
MVAQARSSAADGWATGFPGLGCHDVPAYRKPPPFSTANPAAVWKNRPHFTSYSGLDLRTKSLPS